MIKIILELNEEFLMDNCNPIKVNSLFKEGKIDAKMMLAYLTVPIYISNNNIKEIEISSEDMSDENLKELFTKIIVNCVGLLTIKDLKTEQL